LPKQPYHLRLKAVIEENLSGTFNTSQIETAAYQAGIEMPADQKRGTQAAVQRMTKDGYLKRISPLKRRNTASGMEFTLATYSKAGDIEG